MNKQLVAGVGSILLSSGAATAAILGPLWLDVIQFRVSENMETQAVGGDIVSLAIVAPLAIIAGLLWLRGHALAPVLTLGPSLYAIYYVFTVVLGAQYDRYPGNNEEFFPLYLAITILAATLAIRAWSGLSQQPVPEPGVSLRRVTGWVLVAINTLIGLAWASSIWGVASGTNVTDEYLGDPNMFWVIRLLDTGFVIPASIATGIGLLFHRRIATRAAYGLLGFLTCEVSAIAGMAVVMQWRNDPYAEPVFLVFTLVAAAIMAVLSWRWLVVYRQEAQPLQQSTLTPQAAHRKEYAT